MSLWEVGLTDANYTTNDLLMRCDRLLNSHIVIPRVSHRHDAEIKGAAHSHAAHTENGVLGRKSGVVCTTRQLA
jgi:hypothetical protein